MKKLAPLMILTMLLTLCACGRQCGDKPSEKTPDSVPEACSAYYDYTSLEPIVSENSELPLSDDAQIGTTDHLGLWYNGEYSFIKAGGDGGYTVDELTDGKGSEQSEYGRFAWDGKRYHCIHLKVSDGFVPGIVSEGGVLWLEIDGDCTADTGVDDISYFSGFDCVVITGSGTLTLEQGIDCGSSGTPFPALIVDGVDVSCPTVSLAASSSPKDVPNLVMLGGSLTVDTLIVEGDVVNAGGELSVGTLVNCLRLVCRSGDTVLDGWGGVDAFETQRRSLLLSGGSFKTEWPDEGTDYLLWKGRISCQGIKNFPTVEVLGDELTMIDPMDEG